MFRERSADDASAMACREAPNRRHRAALLLLATLALAAGLPRPARAGSLQVVTYNVRGLPAMVSGDAPGARATRIGPRLGHYDVALLQEDFAHSANLMAGVPRRRRFRGSGPRFRPAYLPYGALLSPVLAACWLTPNCHAPLGDGLTVLVREDLRASRFFAAAFDDCHGYLTALNDCFSNKGVLGVRLETPAGTVDLYDTHLDAGRGPGDHRARQGQIRQLVEHVRTHSPPEHGVILAGDLNLDSGDSGDLEVLEEFAREAGLRWVDVPRERHWGRDFDHVFYRSGTTVGLRIADAGEDAEFTESDEPLSDHPALGVRFDLKASGLPPID